MYCYQARVQSQHGDARANWQVECVSNADSVTVIPIFSDNISTPIVGTSGIANRAKTETLTGNFKFFVPDGIYALRYYNELGVFQYLETNIPMYGADTIAYVQGAAAAALLTKDKSGNAPLRLPTIGSALTATPTVTLALVTSGTNVPPYTGTQILPDTTKYSFRGGANYIRSSGTNPYYFSVIIQPSPITTTRGFGNAISEFYTDDPAPVFTHHRETAGSTRVFCDSLVTGQWVELFSVLGTAGNGTATAGAAGTITLAVGSSAVNGIYTENFIRIMSGTGAGQIRQISGYVGATRVATVKPVWTTAPDATSVYEMAASRFDWTNASNVSSLNYITADWGGERRERGYRVEHSGCGFFGVNVSSPISSVYPAQRHQDRQVFWCGDSHSAGTGAAMGPWGSFGAKAAALLGWEVCNLSVGGTGDLGPGTSVALPNRLFPAVNSWFVQYSGVSVTGSFTVTQSGTTVTILATDLESDIQTKFNTAFGAGNFEVVFGYASYQRDYWFFGQNSLAASAAPMTANFTSLIGTEPAAPHTPSIQQYRGELYNNVYRDDAGLPYPFMIVLANGTNDTTDTSAAYTPTAVQAALTLLITNIMTYYPMATIVVTGAFFPRAGLRTAAVNATTAARYAASATAPLINGKRAFIDSTGNTAGTTAWSSGTGYHGGQTGTGNCDIVVGTDFIHMHEMGHQVFGFRAAQEIQALLQVVS